MMDGWMSITNHELKFNNPAHHHTYNFPSIDDNNKKMHGCYLKCIYANESQTQYNIMCEYSEGNDIPFQAIIISLQHRILSNIFF